MLNLPYKRKKGCPCISWYKLFFSLAPGTNFFIPEIVVATITLLEWYTIPFSRVTSNKYAATSFGNVLLKDLFTEGLPSDSGESVSSRVIQHAIKEIIDIEDKAKPFTDHQLVAELSEHGFKIARRTVAKYREMLRIPTAQLRAIWK